MSKTEVSMKLNRELLKISKKECNSSNRHDATSRNRYYLYVILSCDLSKTV